MVMMQKIAKSVKGRKKTVLRGASRRKGVARKDEAGGEAGQACRSSEEREGSGVRPRVALLAEARVMAGGREVGAPPPPLPVPIASFTI